MNVYFESILKLITHETINSPLSTFSISRSLSLFVAQTGERGLRWYRMMFPMTSRSSRALRRGVVRARQVLSSRQEDLEVTEGHRNDRVNDIDRGQLHRSRVCLQVGRFGGVCNGAVVCWV